MNELITISKMTSMQIAEITEKQHGHIMRDIKDEIEKLEFAGISTQSKFGLSERQDSTGRTLPYYELTKEGVLQLAARYDAVVRAKLIELAMRQERQLPSNYKEALLALVSAEEEKEKLQLESSQKDQIIESQRPKVIFAEALEVSSNTILIGELAKILRQNGIEIGQNRLFEKLREEGYLIKKKSESFNQPTQYSMELGLFEIKKRTINNPDGSVRATTTTVVTGKGQIYFINKFKGDLKSA